MPGGLTHGHLKALELLEDTVGYRTTGDLYHNNHVAVYLRPTDKGLVVISLDHEGCRSMIGVGARDTDDHVLNSLPPNPEAVHHACAGYILKRDSLRRDSVEERYALRLMAGAFIGTLSLNVQPNLYFVHQEWRFVTNEREKKIDLLAADPSSGRFWIIELKDSEKEARRHDSKKGGDAWAQAADYANLLYTNRGELYPYFERLARAHAKANNAPDALKNFRVKDPWPATMVMWPTAPAL